MAELIIPGKPKYCINCHYWNLGATTTCRRRSPTRDLQQVAVWPIVPYNEFCGDWEIASQSTIDERKLLLKESNENKLTPK